MVINGQARMDTSLHVPFWLSRTRTVAVHTAARLGFGNVRELSLLDTFTTTNNDTSLVIVILDSTSGIAASLTGDRSKSARNSVDIFVVYEYMYGYKQNNNPGCSQPPFRRLLLGRFLSPSLFLRNGILVLRMPLQM